MAFALSLLLYHQITCDSVYNTDVIKVIKTLPGIADGYLLL